MSKRDWEEAAEVAALADTIRYNAVNKLGLSDSDVKIAFIDVLAESSEPQLLLEVSSILQEKPEAWSPDRISAINALCVRTLMLCAGCTEKQCQGTPDNGRPSWVKSAEKCCAC